QQGESLVPALAIPALLPSLVKSTREAVHAFQAPSAAKGLVSVNAMALAQGVLQAMTVCQWRVTAVLLLILASLGTGAGWLGYRALGGAPEAEETSPGAFEATGQAANHGLASPLSKLDPERIPVEDRFPWHPPELVAVLGEHRGRHWGEVRGVVFSPD